MSDKIKVLSLLSVGALAVSVMLGMYFFQDDEQPPDYVIKEKVIVEGMDSPKEEPEPGLTDRSELPPISSNDKVVVVGNTISNKQISVPEKEVTGTGNKAKPHVGKSNKMDETSPVSMWSYLNDSGQSKEARSKYVELFKKLMATSLTSGIVPSFIDKNNLLMTNKSESGFSRSVYSFPNGTVELITMVLPELVDDNKRTVYYSVLTSGGEVKVTTVDGLDLIPKERALFTDNGSSYILLVGTRLDSKAFTQEETVRLAALRLDSKGLGSVSFDSSVSSLEVPKDLGSDNVLTITPESPSLAPIYYTEVEREGTVPNRIQLILSKSPESKKLYYLTVNNGNVSLVFEQAAN